MKNKKAYPQKSEQTFSNDKQTNLIHNMAYQNKLHELKISIKISILLIKSIKLTSVFYISIRIYQYSLLKQSSIIVDTLIKLNQLKSL